MSLVYCNYGLRDYRTKPIIINTRGYWEFQLTVAGRNVLKKLDSDPLTWNEAHNFHISTPDSTHGWSSVERESSVVAVFHFSEVPETLAQIFQGRTTLSVKVDQTALDSSLSMAKEMAPKVLNPHYTSILEFEICCRKLCLLFLRNSEENLDRNPWNHHSQIVSASIAWYCANMNEGIGIQETADKMGYSVSQLRKIFVKTRGIGPNGIFEECRMNRARELIQHGQMSIIEISMECGYSNQSSFSRAFKKYYNMPPLQLKKSHIAPY
jgi:AraC-like DNA-binding protein